MKDMVTIRNKRTGETREVPRSQVGHYTNVASQPQQQLAQSLQQEPELGRFMSGVKGFNTGVERFAMGPEQLIAKMIGPKAEQFMQRGAERREHEYERGRQSHPGYTELGKILGEVGVTLPFFEAGGAAATKYLPNAGKFAQTTLGGAAGGATVGGLADVMPGESRASNMGIGAGLGAGLPIVGMGLSKVGSLAVDSVEGLLKHIGYEPSIIREMLKQYSPEEIMKALRTSQLAKSLGARLTPAEASGSNIGAAWEGRLGTSPQGARTFQEYKAGQLGAQENAINDLGQRISANSENASEELRESARSIINKEETALQEKARPFYEASEREQVSANTLNSLTKKDGNIDQAFRAVTNKALYRKELKGYAPNSIKTLQLVKENLDGQIAAAIKVGDKGKVRILTDSKNRLVRAMDKVSSKYKEARAIYAEDSPAIDALRNREMGKLAQLSDKEIKKAANVIFDPAQTDPKVMAKLRDEFLQESPEVWHRFVRNQMENKLATAYRGTTGYHGTNFYRQILANDKTYNQFRAALKGDKKALYRLDAMKHVFKDLINEPTVKGAAAQAKTSMSATRSSWEAAKKFAKNLTGGKYDQAAINIITTPKWEKAFRDAAEKQTKKGKITALAKILESANEGSRKALAPLVITKATETAGKPLNIYSSGDIFRDKNEY